jgi:hypothetical protein
MNSQHTIAVKYAKRGRHSKQTLFGLSIVLFNVVFAAFQVDLLRALGLPSRHYTNGDPLSQQVRPDALRVIAGREISGAGAAQATPAAPSNKP